MGKERPRMLWSSRRLFCSDTHIVVAVSRIVEHRIQFDVLQVYLHVVVARLALVKLDCGTVGRQRQHR